MMKFIAVFSGYTQILTFVSFLRTIFGAIPHMRLQIQGLVSLSQFFLCTQFFLNAEIQNFLCLEVQLDVQFGFGNHILQRVHPIYSGIVPRAHLLVC